MSRPNWYGMDVAEFEWRGNTADPGYFDTTTGKEFDGRLVEDTMWERFTEYGAQDAGVEPTEDNFTQYMLDHQADVQELINLQLHS